MHNKGEWMLSYRFMTMSMDGNRDGTTSLSTDDVLSNYMVAPERMDMQMHMLGLMVAPWQRCTLMFMAPYVFKSMDHVTRIGAAFTSETSGIGDLSATALVRLLDTDTGHLQATAGISIPTGSIDETGNIPMGNGVQLPYPMQLGSGTWDPILGLTWTSTYTRWSWGVQGSTRLRVANNDRDYHLGNRGDATAWAGLVFGEWVSVSGRLFGSREQNIHGADAALNPMMVPTADPNRRAGTRFGAGAGLNLIVPHGPLAGLRLAVEFGAPLYQDLDGPQLETDWTLVAGIQYARAW